MATAAPPLPPKPDANMPVVDPRTGKLTPVWDQWFQAVNTILRTVRSEIP